MTELKPKRGVRNKSKPVELTRNEALQLVYGLTVDIHALADECEGSDVGSIRRTRENVDLIRIKSTRAVELLESLLEDELP